MVILGGGVFVIFITLIKEDKVKLTVTSANIVPVTVPDVIVIGT